MSVAKDQALAAEALAGRRLSDTTVAMEAERVARARAEREASRAQRTKAFLLHLYDSVDPLNANLQDITVRAVIDAITALLEQKP